MQKTWMVFVMILSVFFLPTGIEAQADHSVSVFIAGARSYPHKVIARFQQLYPDVKVNVVERDEDILKQREKLTNDLLNGTAADIILFDGHTFFSILELIQSGVFYDLNEIIPPTDYDPAQFNEVVFNSGVIYGKRYFIPFSYSLPIFATTKELLDKNKLKLDNFDYTQRELADYIIHYVKQNRGNESKFFFDRYFNTWLFGSGLYNVSYDHHKFVFNEKQLGEVLTILKELKEHRIAPVKKGVRFADEVKSLADEAIIAFEINRDRQNPQRLQFWFSMIKETAGQKMRLIAIPIYTQSDGYIATPQSMVAVSVTAKNKEAIANFIKVLLSEEMQKYNTFGLQINNKALDYAIDRTISTSKDKDIAEVLTELRSIIDNIKHCNISFDGTLKDIINKASLRYFAGEITSRECIDILNYEIQRYFIE